MKLTANRHHDKHEVYIHLNVQPHAHYAGLRCAECEKHIQWLNRYGVEKLEQQGIEVDDFDKATTEIANSFGMTFDELLDSVDA